MELIEYLGECRNHLASLDRGAILNVRLELYQVDNILSALKTVRGTGDKEIVVEATLATERDEARKEVERLKRESDSGISEGDPRVCSHGFVELTPSELEWIVLRVPGFKNLLEEFKSGILDTAELAALKSAPAMAEVDALSGDFTVEECDQPCLTTWMQRNKSLADIARRSISSREEVVGLLTNLWAFERVRDVVNSVSDYPPFTRILEIVEGK